MTRLTEGRVTDSGIRPRRLRVHGRVQGVGFRAFVWREAAELGADGWVRNRIDGTVEALVWAEPEILDRLLERVREGPRWGRVDRLDVTVEDTRGNRPSGFEIRRDR
jgi:acylphosphatase